MADFTLTGSPVTGGQVYQALRTVTFKSVLHGVARRCGYKPESRDLSDERAAALTEFINERVREAWEYPVGGWPDLRWVEQRYYHQGLWAAGSYAVDSIVYHADSEAYYQANTGTSEEPAADADDWDEVTSYSKLIPWEQLNQTKIGAVLQVLKSDPRKNRTPTPLGYKQVDREGIYVLDSSASTSVWLELEVREPEFTSTAHVASTSYDLYDVVYLPATGECYRSLAASNAVADPSSSGDWDLMEFPHVFAAFVKLGACADWLRSQQQFDVAERLEAKAFQRLGDVLNKTNGPAEVPATAVRQRGAAVW